MPHPPLLVELRHRLGAHELAARRVHDRHRHRCVRGADLYTGRVFDKGQAGDRDKLQVAITKTQIELTKLRDELPRSDVASVGEYSDELDKLSKHLRNVKGPNDLGPVYVSAQRILELHDKLSEKIRGQLDVSIF